MQTKSSTSSTSTVLIVLIMVLTFPIWIGLAGGLFGLGVGLFGAIIGIIAGVFGAVLGAIGGMFGWFFDWEWHSWPFAFFWNVKLIVITMIVVAIILVTRSRNTKR